MSLLYIGQQLTIYIGLFLIVTGVFGNTMNALIFWRGGMYDATPSAFYLLVDSINNNLYILIVLTSRVISFGYGIDLTRGAIIWCKARQFLAGSLSAISYSCTCLAIIDQFLVTSQNIQFRRRSQMKWAYRIVIIVILIWCAHGIPICIYYDISSITNTCVSTNAAYTVYLSVYVLLVLCAIPVVIMIIFGCLTHQNIRHTRVLVQERADRQLTRMVLMQVVIVLFSSIPYGVFNAYNTITANVLKDADRQQKEYFASTIILLTTYLYYVGTFYIFLISSSRFRQKVKDQIFWWCQANQIQPN